MDNLAFVDKVCRLLAVLIAIGLLLLLIIQGMLQLDEIRSILVPMENWEGERIPFA